MTSIFILTFFIILTSLTVKYLSTCLQILRFSSNFDKKASDFLLISINNFLKGSQG